MPPGSRFAGASVGGPLSSSSGSKYVPPARRTGRGSAPPDGDDRSRFDRHDSGGSSYPGGGRYEGRGGPSGGSRFGAGRGSGAGAPRERENSRWR